MTGTTFFVEAASAAGSDGSRAGTWIALVALLISLIAAIFSGVALWRTHFTRGSVIFTPRFAQFSVTQWTNDGCGWFTPDIAISASIANTGVRPIVVQGLRVRVGYRGLPIPDAHEIWDFNMELDTTTELRSGPGRSVLKARSGTGPPFIVLSKAVVDKRFVCWSRWEKPVIQDLRFTLEAKTTRSRSWVAIESWSFNVTPQDWVYMTGKGTIISLPPESLESVRFNRETHPKDLHKYTGPTESLPELSSPPTPSHVVHEGSDPDRR
ncbi:hypothetical protein [Cellulomonas sp. P24]|uniref:hypothetical protein n=1 Tax=Cellulomonas sp. P24 TaxID=2885206 RepID=UPI00216ABE18|nr:hypothetical protein [Cellulomonas sp. P24]MCR6491540.1 hypothetical protein [Cellulomonas sp. P24]